MVFVDGYYKNLTLDNDTLEAKIGLSKTTTEVIDYFYPIFLQMARQEGVVAPDQFELPKNYGRWKLDEYCKQHYNGISFDNVFQIVRNFAYTSYLDHMADLSIRGNPLAINLMNEYILNKQQDSIVQINFVNALPLESEDDKLNDDE